MAAAVCLLAACGGGAATGAGPDEPEPAEVAADEGGGGEGEGEGEAEAPDEPQLPGPSEDIEIAAPAPPNPPDLGTPQCPAGWTPEAQADPASGPGPCVPPPEVACAGATAQFASSPQCEAIGLACPEDGDFPPEEALQGFVERGATSPVIYVSLDGPPDGDGGRARPFRRIDLAVEAAEAQGGGIVALAEGMYRGPTIELRRASLVGACASGVVLSPRGTRTAIVHVEAAVPVTVANLTLTGPERGIAITGGVATTDVRHVVLEAVTNVGVGYNLRSAGGVIEDLVVRGVEAGNDLGLGVLSADGAEVIARRLDLRSVQGAALAAMEIGGVPGATLDAEDVRTGGAEDERGKDGQVGAFCQADCGLSLRRWVVSGPYRHGLRAVADNEGGEPRLDIDVAQIGPLRSTGDFAEGFILIGAKGSIRRTGVRQVAGVGLAAVAAQEASLIVEDVRIEDVFPAGEVMGTGLSAQAGDIELRRVVVRGAEGLGLQILGQGTFLSGEDVLLEAIDALIVSRGAKPTAGDAVRVYHGASAALTRLRIDGANSEGIVVIGEPGLPSSHLDLTDAEIIHTSPATGSFLASGVSVYDGASLTMERVSITDNEGVGFVCLNQKDLDPPVVRASDLFVARSTASRRVDVGAGMLIEGGCRFDGQRLEIVDNDLAGLWTDAGAYLDASSGAIEDLVIRGTRSTPTDHRLGYGAIFTQGSQFELKRALISGNRMAGIAASGWGRSPETRVIAESVVVRDTEPSVCGELPDDDPLACRADGKSEGVGAGVIGQLGARVTLKDFLITRSAFAGLVAGRDATVRASHGRITDNSLGLAIWEEEYDLDAYFQDVFNYDNATDVAVQELSVPVPSAALAEGLGLD